MVNGTATIRLDVTIPDGSEAWSDNPLFVRSATATGHYVQCARCRRVVGVGKDDEGAERDVQENRTGVKHGNRFFCNQHSSR